MGTEELLFPSFPPCQRSQAVSRQNQVNILLMVSPKPTISQWLNMKKHTINSTADILWCAVMCDWKGTKKSILLFLDLTQLQGLITVRCFESTQYTYLQKPKCPETSGCSLWVKPTDALNSNFIAITTLHVSGSLSVHHQEFLAIHRHWYILCSVMTVCYQQ